MKTKAVLFSCLGVLLLLIGMPGCRRSEPAPPPAPAPAAPSAADSGPQAAQPRLPTLTLWMGSKELTAEIALEPVQWATGLMFRTNMPENEGMLFIFPRPHQASFWMKNTFLPLSVAYINTDGIIAEIHDLQPRNTNSVKAASSDIVYVLEVNRGWFQRHQIAVGTKIVTARGSLDKAFPQQ